MKSVDSKLWNPYNPYNLYGKVAYKAEWNLRKHIKEDLWNKIDNKTWYVGNVMTKLSSEEVIFVDSQNKLVKMLRIYWIMKTRSN